MKRQNDENGLPASIAEVDRMLLTALKKNLKSARHLAASLPEGPQKENLDRMLKNHLLSPPEKVIEEPVTVPSEAMKRHSKLDRYLGLVTEENFQTVLDLVKSFSRRNTGRPKGGVAMENRLPKPRGRRKKESQELGAAPTSDSSAATASDSNTEAGTP